MGEGAGVGAVRAAVSGLGSSFAVSLLPARLSLPSRASAPALGSAAPGAVNLRDHPWASSLRMAACLCAVLSSDRVASAGVFGRSGWLAVDSCSLIEGSDC